MSVCVVAIDFGTTYSGYAFSVSHWNTELSNVQILANQAWNSGLAEVISQKTPTCLLLRDVDEKRRELVSFGYEAENRYAEEAGSNNLGGFYFFHRFKMNLHNNKDISSGIMLKDVQGKELSALEVFSFSIKALKIHLDSTIEEKHVFINEKTRWVLTVPAIWTDTAKRFMRKAAKMADIPGDKLILALEPEAASIYCQVFPSAGSLDIVRTGSKYLVVDMGGGTVDITAHEKLGDGSLKEITRASGNDCGGVSVDERFIQMIGEIFGQQLLDKMKKDFPESYLTLVRCFENVKRTIREDQTRKINVTIPVSALTKLCSSALSRDIESVINESPYSSLYLDKLRLNAFHVKSLFSKTTENIVSLISKVLKEQDAEDSAYILLVGGFANCKLIQKAIKDAFQNKTVVVPEDGGLAVLKGAVLFGYNPSFISSRITRYSYGVRVVRQFDDTNDDERRKIYIEGKALCDNVFQEFMKANTSVPIGKKIKHTYSTSEKFQQFHILPVYYTEKENEEYTDTPLCHELGQIEVEIPDPTEEERDVNVVFHFGKTELSVTATDNRSGEECKTSFAIQDFA